jgi:hypothetical protein
MSQAARLSAPGQARASIAIVREGRDGWLKNFRDRHLPVQIAHARA